MVEHIVIGRSPAIRTVIALVRQVAQYPATVLIQGESGTGKDVVARALHAASQRTAYQFVDINCAAIPETLLETELFGVEAGAFTDAKVSRDGYLSRADGGTLFLDEIGSMPLILQTKLLRVLETRRFRRVGGTKELEVNVRIISATNVDLQRAVAHKTFREDLFYRLKVITIPLLPLRERPEDIEPLVAYFLHGYNADHPAEAEPLRMSKEAMELLLQYSWPGNVRELRAAVQHGQVMCDHNLILPKDLPENVYRAKNLKGRQLQELQQQLHLPPEGLDLQGFLSDIEYRFIQEALEYCNGNQVQAAALLGISRDQLRYRLLH